MANLWHVPSTGHQHTYCVETSSPSCPENTFAVQGLKLIYQPEPEMASVWNWLPRPGAQGLPGTFLCLPGHAHMHAHPTWTPVCTHPCTPHLHTYPTHTPVHTSTCTHSCVYTHMPQTSHATENLPLSSLEHGLQPIAFLPSFSNFLKNVIQNPDPSHQTT